MFPPSQSFKFYIRSQRKMNNTTERQLMILIINIDIDADTVRTANTVNNIVHMVERGGLIERTDVKVREVRSGWSDYSSAVCLLLAQLVRTTAAE